MPRATFTSPPQDVVQDADKLTREDYNIYVLNVFIDIQTSKELIQMDTDKMMTYGTFTMDDEKLTQT